ncbi:hypothetical protein [Mycobacterium phage WXIN]|nr:hypothetical protein [Mycobacterium phage WXIN]
MLYCVVRNDDGFMVMDQWGDLHTPICCATLGPPEPGRVKEFNPRTREYTLTDRVLYKTPSCEKVATICLGEGIGDLFCDEHDPREMKGRSNDT